MMFDVRLHTEELIPDNHVHCFRDFEKWLTDDLSAEVDAKVRYDKLLIGHAWGCCGR